MKELLYTKSKDYWMDVQLNKTKCDKCGVDVDPMSTYPIKVENNEFIFVCGPCHPVRINKYVQ